MGNLFKFCSSLGDKGHEHSTKLNSKIQIFQSPISHRYGFKTLFSKRDQNEITKVIKFCLEIIDRLWRTIDLDE